MKLCEVDQLCDGVGMKWKCDAVKKNRGEVPPEFSPEFSKMSGLSPLSS